MEMVALILLLSFFAVPCFGGNTRDLTELSLEELMDVEVTSVSKKPQKLSEVAAAVFVISGEDIRRSGVNSIPEALRMAPGLQVARIDANKWAISSRGFNGRFANKLLVLIDGRSVYTTLTGGVYWDVQDTLLEDIERIEVIRGPGAALWGANAVNGVINIITKEAKNTQGGLLLAGVGTEERGIAGVRYGGSFGEHTHYRVYGKVFNRDGGKYVSGDDSHDNWDGMHAGFRMDISEGKGDDFTLQGDVYHGESDERAWKDSLKVSTFELDSDNFGANLLGRWTRRLSSTDEMAFQLYYDRATRENNYTGFIRLDTIDLDFQHRLAFNECNEVVWGVGYRSVRDDLTHTPFLYYDPESSNRDLFSGFIQDDISLIEDRLCLTVGSKFEYNDYTGFEVQPGIRMIWAFRDRQSVWAAVSRAVRTPSRVEQEGRVTTIEGPPTVYLYGGDHMKSEEVTAFEVGYRIRTMGQWSVDLATFYNIYDRLRTFEWLGPLVLGGNKMKGKTYGLETSFDWNATKYCRIQASYTYLRMNLQPYGDSTDLTAANTDGDCPRHQVSIRSSVDLGGNVEIDGWVRYVGEMPYQNVEEYVTLDVRLCWGLLQNIDLSIVGQNLLDSRHPEFEAEIVNALPTEIERSVYGKATWRF